MARGTPDWGLVTGGPQAVLELPSYVLSNTAGFIMPTADSLISLLNPAASGRLAKVRRITITLEADVDNTIPGLQLKLHRITAHGTGTALTPRPFDTGDAAAVCTGRQNLTVEPGYGVQLGAWISGVIVNTAVGEKYAGTTTFEFRVFDYSAGGPVKPLTLLAGEGITLEVDVNVNSAANTCAVIEFTEELV